MTQQELEARIKRLEDIEEIKKLMWGYTYALDYGELDRVMDCFVDDAVIEVGMRGGAEEGQAALEGRYEGVETIRRFCRLVLSPKDRFVVAHLVLNPVVTVKGDMEGRISGRTRMSDKPNCQVPRGFEAYRVGLTAFCRGNSQR